MTGNLKIFTDGGSRGNPGPGASAFVAKINNEIVKEDSKFFVSKTNNETEYEALLMALNWLSINESKGNKSFDSVDIFLDSQLVVRQLMGIYKIKSQNLKPLFSKCRSLINSLNLSITLHHVKREANKRADELVNRELDNNLK